MSQIEKNKEIDTLSKKVERLSKKINDLRKENEQLFKKITSIERLLEDHYIKKPENTHWGGY